MNVRTDKHEHRRRHTLTQDRNNNWYLWNVLWIRVKARFPTWIQYAILCFHNNAFHLTRLTSPLLTLPRLSLVTNDLHTQILTFQPLFSSFYRHLEAAPTFSWWGGGARNQGEKEKRPPLGLEGPCRWWDKVKERRDSKHEDRQEKITSQHNTRLYHIKKNRRQMSCFGVRLDSAYYNIQKDLHYISPQIHHVLKKKIWNIKVFPGRDEGRAYSSLLPFPLPPPRHLVGLYAPPGVDFLHTFTSWMIFWAAPFLLSSSPQTNPPRPDTTTSSQSLWNEHLNQPTKKLTNQPTNQPTLSDWHWFHSPRKTIRL